MYWVKQNRGALACAILLAATNIAEASFLSDLLRGQAITTAEKQSVEKVPDCALSADDAHARIIELLSDGRQGEAEDLATSAVKTHRSDIRILFAKAVLERSRWDKEVAQVWFTMARKAKGNDALSRAAWLSMELDRGNAVKKNMGELIRLSGENPDDIFLLWLGAIQCREQSGSGVSGTMAKLGKERYEKLLGHFQLGPVMVHHTFANILAESLYEYEPALEHRLLAVSMESRHWSLYGLGNTLVSMDKNEWGCAVLARVVRQNRYNAKYMNRLGDALYKMKRYAEAEEVFRKAVSLNPEGAWLWDDLADCQEKLGKYQEMFIACQKAVELGADSALGNLGWCYLHGHGVEKNGQLAFELLSRYRAYNQESTWVLEQLGVCYANGIGVEEDFQKSRSCYETAVNLKPNRGTALNALAWDLITNKDQSLHDYSRAVELAERAVAVAELHCNFDTLAVACFKDKQYEEAAIAQKRSIAAWQSEHPGHAVPASFLERLERYRKMAEEAED